MLIELSRDIFKVSIEILNDGKPVLDCIGFHARRGHGEKSPTLVLKTDAGELKLHAVRVSTDIFLQVSLRKLMEVVGALPEAEDIRLEFLPTGFHILCGGAEFRVPYAPSITRDDEG